MRSWELGIIYLFLPMENMVQLSKRLLVLLFLVAMLAKQEVMSALTINDEQERQAYKMLISHANLISMEKYPGYMIRLRKRCFAAATDPHFANAAQLFEEIVLYDIPVINFQEIKKHHQLVLGYFRSTISEETYNNDIGRLLLQYAYIDWLKENSSLVQLKQQLWVGKRLSKKAMPILKIAQSLINRAFITEFLLTCMQRERRGDQLDLSCFKDFFVENVQKSVLLHKDNFLNVPLLNWLRERWPAVEKMLRNPDEIIYFDEYKLDHYNPYLSIWLKNGSVTAEELSVIVKKEWEQKRFSNLFALALHGKLKKVHFPAHYPMTNDVIKLLSYKRRRNYIEANLLRYYLRFIISKDECKKILMHVINSFNKYKKMPFGIFKKCYFPKKDTYFRTIFRGLMCKTQVNMNPIYDKGGEYELWIFGKPRRYRR